VKRREWELRGKGYTVLLPVTAHGEDTARVKRQLTAKTSCLVR
jgi:hypothetical protein